MRDVERRDAANAFMMLGRRQFPIGGLMMMAGRLRHMGCRMDICGWRTGRQAEAGKQQGKGQML